MNPLGFLSNDELLAYNKEVEAETLKLQKSEEKSENLPKDANYIAMGLKPGTLPKEVGYKVKGLEPTRYGDWERNGRVTDF